MTRPQPQIPLVRGSEYRENYANGVQVSVSLWDFFILFGIVRQEAPGSPMSVENFQAVYLSPPLAKSLFNVLQQNILRYEEVYGEIRLEPQAQGGLIQ